MGAILAKIESISKNGPKQMSKTHHYFGKYFKERVRLRPEMKNRKNNTSSRQVARK